MESGLKLGLTLLALVLVAVGCRFRTSQDAAILGAVRGVLERQVDDWNAGKLEDFMNSYLKSESTRFASGGQVQMGWERVLQRYQDKYPNRELMGRLQLAEVDVQVLASDSAVAFGSWQLVHSKGEASGLFTLVFRRTKDGWKITHDHTSQR